MSTPVVDVPEVPDVGVDASTANEGGRVPSIVIPAIVAVLVGIMALLMFASHRAGHWWGDDWALYLRQAEGLIGGNPGEVRDDNHFTVDRSLGAPFSPPLYPWGFPLLLAPFVAVVGTDVDALTIVPVLCACGFACAWYSIAHRRIGAAAALAGTVAATLTPLLFSWTELIQSEWPFLAVTFAMLVAVDRAIETEVLTDTTRRWWPLVVLGIGAAAAFTVRREGLAMTAAVAAAQLGLLTTGRPRMRAVLSERRLALRLVVPHASALATVYLLQWLLPSTLVPEYSGTSVRNAYRFWRRHVNHLADVSGLKRPWDTGPVVLGSDLLGDVVVAVYLIAALAGAVMAVTVHRRRDLHLVVYAVAAFLIGASFRSALNRYMATVGPVLFLLGLVALVTIAGRRRRRWGVAAAIIAATLVVAGNLANVNQRVDRATEFAAADAVEWGPTHPDAVAMFDAVEANSGDDDVVAGPKARALTLLTDRRSIQVDQWRPLPDDWSPALVVAERSSPTDALLADSDRYDEVWSNPRFAIYRAVDDLPRHP